MKRIATHTLSWIVFFGMIAVAGIVGIFVGVYLGVHEFVGFFAEFVGKH